MTDSENSGGYEALSIDDVEAIADPFCTPAVSAVAAEVRGSQQVSYGGEDTRVTVVGVTANYSEVRNLEIALGSALSGEDNDSFWPCIIVIDGKDGVLCPNASL